MRRLLLACFLLLAAAVRADEFKPRVLAIEEAIRAVSERYFAMQGSYPSWPVRTSDGADPGPFPDDGFYGDDLLDDDATYTLVNRIYFRVTDLAFSSLKEEIVDGGDPLALVTLRNDLPPAPTIDTFADTFAQLQPLVKKVGRTWGARSDITARPDVPSRFQAGSVSDFVPCDTGIQTIMANYATGNNGNSIFMATAENQIFWTRQAVTTANLRSTDSPSGLVSVGGLSTIDGATPYFFDSSPPGPIKLFTTVTERRTDRMAGTFTISTGPFAYHSTVQGGQTVFTLVQSPRGWPEFITCSPFPVDKEDTRLVTLYCMSLATFTRSWDRVWTREEECSACATTCTAGTAGFGNSSLEFQLSLGMGRDGSAGTLRLFAETPAGNLGSPAALRFALRMGAVALYDQTQVTFANLPAPRQILAPQVLADIVPLDAYRFEVRSYRPADKGTAGANGLYAPAVAPFSVTQVENLDLSAATSSHVRITVTTGSDVERADFTYDAAARGWTLRHERHGETRIESRSSTTDALGRRVERHKWLDDAGNVLRDVRNTFQVFAWNTGPNARNPEELVEAMEDPDGFAEATSYSFYTDAAADGLNYGRLKRRVEPTGYWQQFEYDDGGRVAKTTTPLGHAAPGATRSVRVHTTTFSFSDPQWTDVDTLVLADGTTVEVGRRYRTANSGTAQAIVAPIAGAPYNATGNLATMTRYVTFGTFWGRVQIFARPDGTGFINVYSTSAGRVTTTTFEGAFNAAKNNIVAGTRTITVTDDKSQVVSESKFDIVTGLSLGTKAATQFDADGRVTRYDYSSGDTELFSYGCCGLDYQVGRDGVRTSYTYDAWGHVRTRSRGGITERYAYDLLGRRTGTYRIGTDGTELPVETRIFNAVGEVISTTAAGLRTTTFAKTFDATGHLVRSATFADGGTRVATYVRDGSLVALDGTAVAPVAYEYGVDAAGVFTKEVRGGAGGPQTEWVKAYVDFAGRSYRTEYPDGAVEQDFYNSLGQLARRVDADGVSTVYAYDNLAQPEYVAVDLNRNGAIDQAGTDRITRTRREVASAHGTVVSRTTTSVWTTDNAATAQDIAVAETSFDGRRTWQTTLGLTTQFQATIDGLGGRTETTTAPDGTTLTRRFDGDRLVSATKAATGIGTLAAQTFAYDAHGRVQGVTDARNGATTFTYYNDDQVETSTSPDPDPARTGPGADPQLTRYTYDAMGRPSTVTAPDGAVTTTTYYATGQLKRTSGARTFPSEYTYDSQGRVKTLTTWQDYAGDAGKAVTTWNYDPRRGWLTAKLRADGTGPGFTYTAAGRLKTRTWARGTTTTYNYDAAGATFSTTYSDATPAVTLGFDRLGRVITKTDGTGACTYAYNGLTSQVASETHTAGLLAGFTLSRGFDGLKRLGNVSVLAGPATVNQVALGYDAASRVQTVTAGTLVATYGYAANSPLVESLTLAVGATPRLATSKVFDRVNRLVTLMHAPAGGPSFSYDFAYDAADQRVRATREDGTAWHYGYDVRGEVTSVQHRQADATLRLGEDYAYAFDDIGNRRSATSNGHTSDYVTDALNQYVRRTVPGLVDVLGSAASSAIVTANLQGTQRQDETFFRAVSVDNAASAQNVALSIVGVKNNVGPNGESAIATEMRTAFVPRTPEVFAYDADGNLTGDGRWSYTWDAENRLVAMETQPSVSAVLPALQQRLEFDYDLYGRRVRKIVRNGGLTGLVLAQDRRFVYDGWNLQTELDALNANAVARNFVWGLDVSGQMQGAGGVGGLLGFTGGSASYLVAHDGSGNVVGLFDQADGTRAASFEYGAFGEVLRAEGAAAGASPFGFSTKYTDAESGLVYFGARYYETSRGRWLSRDPLGEAAGLNTFAYVDNDGLQNVDLLGYYQEGGHYYTTYIAAMIARKPAVAETLAFYSQLPDEIKSFTAYDQWYNSGPAALGNAISGGALRRHFDDIQRYLHSLDGGLAGPRRDCLRSMLNDPTLEPWETGLLTHAFGDSYAHSKIDQREYLPAPPPNAYAPPPPPRPNPNFNSEILYEAPFGHGGDGSTPDYASQRPELYGKYITDLAVTLNGGPLDATQNARLQFVIGKVNGFPKTLIGQAEIKAFRDIAISEFSYPPGGYAPELHEAVSDTDFPKGPGQGMNYKIPTRAEIDALLAKIQKSCCRK